MKLNYKVEGNIMYSDRSMLTWGPFYYHSRNKAIEKMSKILDDITNWVNLKEPIREIKPTYVMSFETQIVFHILAWKDEYHLEDCKGLIDVEIFDFED